MPKQKIATSSTKESVSAKKIEKKSAKAIGRLLGLKDYVGADFLSWDLAMTKAWELARIFGFSPLRTPIIEDFSLYKKSTRKNSEKEFYFVDFERGEKAVLRPELTQGMIRSYLENKMEELPQPIRLFSVGPVFRQEKMASGRYRESNQFDLEIIGEKKPMAEAVLINSAYRFFKELQINVQVQINSLGDTETRKEYNSKLASFYKERGRRSKLCNHCKKNLLKSPLSLLDCREDSCVKIREGAPQIADYLSAASREHFGKVLEYLDELNIPYNFNSYLVRGLSYYNDTVFEFWPVGEDGVANGKLALAGGGRCDLLVESLGGKPTPGVGLAIGMERAMMKLKEKNSFAVYPDEEELIYVAQIGEQAKTKALLLFEDLRSSGFNVRQSFSVDSLRSQIEEAGRLKAKITLVLGKKEVMDETILMRDMESGVQEIVAQKKIKEKLNKKIIRKVGVIYG
ncbi:MAG: histidine--tRNA ligase [Candidatus Falkowbacteria bacterium]